MGDLLDKAADIYPRKEALVGLDASGEMRRYTYDDSDRPPTPWP